MPEEIHALEKYVVLSRFERAELFGAVNRTQDQWKLGFQGRGGGLWTPLFSSSCYPLAEKLKLFLKGSALTEF